jgi:peptidoglycan/LPS O-acetylase OafA/YrhL
MYNSIFVLKKAQDRNMKRSSLICIIIGIPWLCFSWINANRGYKILPDIDHCVMFGIPYSLILIGILFFFNKIIIDSGFKRLLVFFGNASYSIYLTHYVVIILLIPIFNKIRINNYVIFLVISGIALIIGCIGYKILEEPLLKAIRIKIIKKSKNVA